MIAVTITRPFQTFFSVETNSHNLLSLLTLTFGSKHIAPGIQPYAQLISVRKQGTLYEIKFKDGVYKTADPLLEIDRLIFEHSIYDDSIFALHGGAVAKNQRAFLFLATTQGGKTTLSSYLTMNGCQYITDDRILLDRNSFFIYPCLEPIRLRYGGLSVLEQYGYTPETTMLNIESAPRYVYTPTDCADAPTPLHTIYFLERNEQENMRIPLTTNERMVLLMQSPITPYPVTPSYLRFLTKLSAYPCYRLRYSDMAYVATLIKEDCLHE